MTPEFSKILKLDAPDFNLPLEITITAEQPECIALGKRFDVDIHSLSCQFLLTEARDKVSIKAVGNLTSTVTQECGVTLEPFTDNITASFVVFFSPQGHPKVIQLEEEDQEYYVSPEIDLGEVAAQYLCLHLGTFPRHPEATSPIEETQEVEEKANPFQTLKTLLDSAKKSDT